MQVWIWSLAVVAPITVTPVNTAPVVEAMTLHAREDTVASLPITARDADRDPLVFSLLTDASHGKASVNARGRVRYVPAPDKNGADRFVVGVSDGLATTELAVDVVIAAVNDAPLLTDQAIVGREDAVAGVDLSATDIDGDALTWSLTRGPARGSAVIDPTSGRLQLTPPADWHGTDSLRVRVSDGVTSSSSSVAITFSPVNDAPVIEAMNLATRERERTGARLTVRDVDGDALTFALGAPPTKGTATVDDRGRVAYSPSASNNGADRFVVVVSDGTTAVEAPVDVVIAAVNDAPVVAAAALEGDEDNDVVVTLTGSDVDGDPLTWSIARPPAHGAARLDATGRLSLSPRLNWHGDDEVVVTVSDGSASTSATVPIVVRPVNDPPTLLGLSLKTREDEATSGAIQAGDVDGDALAFTIGEAARHGAASVDTRGRVTYRPRADHHGDDSFVVVASDGKLTVEAAVDVVTSPVNDAPVAGTAALIVAEDGALVARLTGSDVDGDALSFSLVNGPAGALLDAQGALSWTPPANFHGVEKLSFDVDDGQARGHGAVTLTVTPVNDPPLLTVKPLATSEDQAVSGSAQANDVDGDALRFRVAKQGDKGEAVVDATSGAITFTPRPDAWGEDVVVIAVDDGTTSVEVRMPISVRPMPDAPRTSRSTWSLIEDTAGETTLPGSDVDGDALTFRLTSDPTLGAARLIDASNGTVAFTPHADAHGSDELRFEVSDGVTQVPGVLSLAIAPSNDAPVATPLALSTPEDQAVTGKVIMSDVDGDALQLVIIAQPSNANVTITDAARGALRVEPARDVTGPIVFQVAAREALHSAPVDVTVTVTPTNDAPVAQTQSRSAPEDTPITAQLIATDVDGDALSYRVHTAPERGVVVVDAATGRFTYTPRKNVFGDDSFVFVAKDGALQATARVSLRVHAVDDPPIASPGSLTSPRAGRVTGKLLGRDPEGAALRFRIESQPGIGNVVIVDERTGTFAYTPEGGRAAGRTSFAYVVDAGGQTSERGVVTVDVN